MVNWDRLEIMQAWPILRYCTSICQEGLRKQRKKDILWQSNNPKHSVQQNCHNIHVIRKQLGLWRRYSNLLQAGQSRVQTMVEARFSRPSRDQSWGPPSLLHNWFWVSFPGVKQPGHRPPIPF